MACSCQLPARTLQLGRMAGSSWCRDSAVPAFSCTPGTHGGFGPKPGSWQWRGGPRSSLSHGIQVVIPGHLAPRIPHVADAVDGMLELGFGGGLRGLKNLR